MKDKDALLAQIGHMEGKVVTRDLARACREHVGDVGEGVPTLELIKGSLLIMFLKQLGGRMTYTVEQIDNEPADFYLTIESLNYHGKPALRFALKEKD